jgi:hypothetical protein
MICERENVADKKDTPTRFHDAPMMQIKPRSKPFRRATTSDILRAARNPKTKLPNANMGSRLLLWVQACLYLTTEQLEKGYWSAFKHRLYELLWTSESGKTLEDAENEVQELRRMTQNTMTVSALLAGFAVSMSFAVDQNELDRYARWNKDVFFGKDSEFCTRILNGMYGRKLIWNGVWPSVEPTQFRDVSNGNNISCDPSSHCWRGHWGTTHASEVNDFAVSASQSTPQLPGSASFHMTPPLRTLP